MTDRYTLRAGDTEIEVWPLGARLNAARWRDFAGLLDGAATEEEALGDKLNHGCLVGPVANRIAGGACEIDGTPFSFEKNVDGKTLLHSGAASTRDKVFDVIEATEASLTLAIDIADMADGFPGNRRITAHWSAVPDGFDLALSGTTDRATLMNLALHPYWTLDGRGRAGQRIEVAADRYLPIDADKIPTGEIARVDGTIFDLRMLGTPSTDIDHNFCLSGRQPAVRLVADRGIGLAIETDAPGVQVFTGKDFGIAVEPQHWPDTPHHPGFPPILLKPGETYRQTTRYRFFGT